MAKRGSRLRRSPRLESLNARVLLAVDGYDLARSIIDNGVDSYIAGEPIGNQFESADGFSFELFSGTPVTLDSEFFTAFPGAESGKIEDFRCEVPPVDGSRSTILVIGRFRKEHGCWHANRQTKYHEVVTRHKPAESATAGSFNANF